jgi:ParB family transcriptional regulator, chromosome partitioning protein
VETVAISTSRILGDSHVHRFSANEESLGSLKASIRRIGLINPVGVVVEGDQYRVVHGHRRFAACKELGWSEVPCIVLSGDAAKREEVTFAENFFREDLSPVELAVAIARQYQSGDMDVPALAAIFRRSEQWVKNQLGIVDWPPDVLEAVHMGRLSVSAASNLVMIDEDQYRSFLVRTACESGATARTTAAWLSAWRASEPIEQALKVPPGPAPSGASPMVPQAPCFVCHQVKRQDELSHVPVCASCIPTLRPPSCA